MKSIFSTLFVFLQISLIATFGQTITPEWTAHIPEIFIGSELVNSQMHVFAANYDNPGSFMVKYDQEGTRLDSIDLPYMEYISCSFYSSYDNTFLLGGFSFGFDTAILAKADLNGQIIWVHKFGMPGYSNFSAVFFDQLPNGTIVAQVAMGGSTIGKLDQAGYMLFSSEGQLLDFQTLDVLVSDVSRSTAGVLFFNDTTLLLQTYNDIQGVEVVSINIASKSVNWKYTTIGATSFPINPSFFQLTKEREILLGGTYNLLVYIDSLGVEKKKVLVNDKPDCLYFPNAIFEREYDNLEISSSQFSFANPPYGLISFKIFDKDFSNTVWSNDYYYNGIEYMPYLTSPILENDTTIYSVVSSFLSDDGYFLAKFHVPPSKSVSVEAGIVPELAVSVSPNPSMDGTFWVKSAHWPANIEVFDALGRRVFGAVANDDRPISIENPGLYWVRVSDGEKTGGVKVIVGK